MEHIEEKKVKSGVAVDIVTAVRDEEECIPEFVDRIRTMKLAEHVDLKIIFVEDSSIDNTVGVLRKCSEISGVSYYSLKRGYGQGAAVAFGLTKSKADAVIMMDADGEHPIELIPEIINHYLQGADIVQCIRKRRVIKNLVRRMGSFLFNRVSYIITGVRLEEQNVYFRLVASSLKDRLIRDKKWMYFMRINKAQMKGLTMRNVYFDIDISRHRQSKYGFFRLAKFAIDALLSMASLVRFAGLIAVILILAFIGVKIGIPIISIVFLLFAAVLVYRYVSIVTHDILGRIEVVESSQAVC